MKLSRTKEYNFGWLVLLGLVDVAFLLIFFSAAQLEFYLAAGYFRFDAVLAFCAWTAG